MEKGKFMDLRTKGIVFLSLVLFVVAIIMFASYGMAAWFVFVLIAFFVFVFAIMIAQRQRKI
jgi:hypothetical protein